MFMVARLTAVKEGIHDGGYRIIVNTGPDGGQTVFHLHLNILVTTEDGSRGEKGLVTDHSIFQDSGFPYDFIYACGPDGMMKAVAKIAGNKGVECEASLENSMACGFGACLCCVVNTTEGNKCVCTEGPIFNVKDLKW